MKNFKPFPRKKQGGFWGAVIGAGASLLGGAMANKSSAKQADNSMEFQREVAQHGHQWQVQDMRKAGLNPILSATGGSGAKASGGAMATQQDIVTPAVQSALAARRQSEELKQIRASTALQKQQEKTTKEQQFNTFQDTEKKAFESGLLQSQTATEMARTNTELQKAATEQALQNYYRDQGSAAKAMAGKTAHDARSSKVTADLDEKMRAIERAIKAAEGGSSAFRNFLPIPKLRK